MRARKRFFNLREFAGHLAERVSGPLTQRINETFPELRTFIENPQLIGDWVERHSPWVNRNLLSVASNITTPYLAGMGLRVERMTETLVEVSMPQRLRTRAESGGVHVGAITTLADHTARLYWERHLHLGRHSMQVVQIETRLLREAASGVRAVLEIAEGDREATIFRLRSEGQTLVTCPVKIYDAEARLAAEVSVEWRFTSPVSLGSRERS